MTARRFSRAERAQIARLLGLEPEAAADVLDLIEARLEAARWHAAHFARELDQLGLKRLRRPGRGRPRSELPAAAGILDLAEIYRRTTGRSIGRGRADPFFRLAQICLQQADPQALIRALVNAWS